jgi:Family of unknown function (DUF5767)
MEVIDLGINELEPVSLNLNDSSYKPTVNFGGGIEFLMNDKKKSSNSMNLNLGELDTLENELNEITGNLSNNSTSNNNTNSGSSGGSFINMASSFFGVGNNEPTESSKKVSLNIDEEKTDSNLGNATRESIGNTKTWDGFSKMSDVPSNANTTSGGFGSFFSSSSSSSASSGSSSKLSDRDRRRKQRMMIKKMEEWYEKGLTKHNSHFNMDSDFAEVEDEYESAMEDKRRKDSVKLQGWWFMTFINSMEYANAAFNPFDLNLDGWGEQVSEDIDSYDEIFAELYDKYKGGKLAPEISLLLRVVFSAAVLNFSNKALSSATPAFNDVIKQSPELMRMFTDATVNSMSQKSPGFAMASNLMQENSRPRGPPPPAPVETKSQPPPQRPGSGMNFTDAPSNRPDINAGRGAMFYEQGVEINNSFRDVNQEDRSIRQMNIPPQPVQQQQPSQRQEMRGPQSSDIDNILSGLKTRNINIQESVNTEDDSMVSISSLKDIQNNNMPKRSNRKKNGSAKNTISLDI